VGGSGGFSAFNRRIEASCGPLSSPLQDGTTGWKCHFAVSRAPSVCRARKRMRRVRMCARFPFRVHACRSYMRFRDTNLIQVIDHPLVNAAIARLMPRLCKFDAANSRVVFTSAKLIGRRVGERLAWVREKRARKGSRRRKLLPPPRYSVRAISRAVHSRACAVIPILLPRARSATGITSRSGGSLRPSFGARALT